jgi:hypothetical protein
MAYDRYDTRRDRGRYSDYDRGRREDRGFFDRAGDEIASWFGDEDAERRRREDERMNRGWSGQRDIDRDRDWNRDRDWDRNRSSWRGSEGRFNRPASDRDYRGYGGYDRDFGASGYGYGGGYGYSSGTYGGFGAGTDRGYGSGDFGREYEGRDRDRDYHDRNYHAWRQRHLDELDRDYDDYRSENQERFENDFASWRNTKQQKRGLLGNIREHMDVVGSDGETVGKVDCVRGDRVVLTRSDSPDNRHHSIKCSMIDTVEGDQVRLDIPADEAKSRWRDEDDRGFFGREADRERGRESESANLERSFSGTYR